MTQPPPKYHTIPSSGDQSYHPDIHEPVVGESDLISTSECVQTEAQAKWIYFLLGCAILLPWSVLMNGIPFFLSRLAGTPFYTTFVSCMTSVYLLTKLVCQFYSTITSKRSSPSRRVFVSIAAAMLIVTSLCLSTVIRGTPLTFFLFSLSIAVSLAITTAYMCTAVYVGASLLGVSFLQIVMSGEATVAVGVSVVQVVSSAISLWGSSPKPVLMEEMIVESRDDDTEGLAARISFGVSAVFLALTLVSYWWLTRQHFYKTSTGILEQNREVRVADEVAGLVTDVRVRGYSSTEANSRVYYVFGQNVSFMFSIAYVYSVSLAVYPAITVRVQPVNPGMHPILFTTVHFLVFNFGDLVGRYSCSFPRLIVWSARKILVMSVLRTLFIPLILLCNVHWQHPAPIAPVSPVIDSDYLFMVILLVMGYTNGYVSTTALLAVSSLEHNPGLDGREDVDIAATLGGSFTIVGLVVGSLSSFAAQAMV